MFLAGANLCPRPETHNALGRSDLEFEAGCLHWVLELKFARQSDAPEAKLKEAADQIRARHYGSGQAKKLLRLAMVYSEKEHHFVAWQQV